VLARNLASIDISYSYIPVCMLPVYTYISIYISWIIYILRLPIWLRILLYFILSSKKCFWKDFLSVEVVMRITESYECVWSCGDNGRKGSDEFDEIGKRHQGEIEMGAGSSTTTPRHLVAIGGLTGKQIVHRYYSFIVLLLLLLLYEWMIWNRNRWNKLNIRLYIYVKN
jgi:hypothetical protein